MSDLSTFTRSKDWIIVALVGVVFTLLGLVAAENRQRIRDLEVAGVARHEVLERHGQQLARLDAIQEQQRGEILRRLDRIEEKLR